jgi:curli biogenesis system outer membrane secretion channel CsgG
MNLSILKLMPLFRRLAMTCLTLVLVGCATKIASVRLPDKVIAYEIPSITVGEFTNKAGRVYGWNVGKGLQEQLIHQLTNSQYFNVLNRNNIQDAVSELSIQASGLTREQGKIKTGHMKNARYIVRGAVTSFDQTSDSSVWGFVKDSLFDAKHQVAVVQITLYVEDLEANQVVASTSISDAVTATDIGYNGIIFGGQTFFKTPLGEATQEVINQAVNYVISKIPKEHWYPSVARQQGGKKIYTVGETVFLSGGINRGVQLGSQWHTFSHGNKIIDPTTGDILGITPTQNNNQVIKITQIHQKYSVAKVLTGQINVGDQLKMVITSPSVKQKSRQDRSIE